MIKLDSVRNPDQRKRARQVKEEKKKSLKAEKQSVGINGEVSQGMEIISGVPQRTVLTGMLINVFMNYVEKETSMK